MTPTRAESIEELRTEIADHMERYNDETLCNAFPVFQVKAAVAEIDELQERCSRLEDFLDEYLVAVEACSTMISELSGDYERDEPHLAIKARELLGRGETP